MLQPGNEGTRSPGWLRSPGSRTQAVRSKERADLRRGDPDPELGELAPDPDAPHLGFSWPILRMSSLTSPRDGRPAPNRASSKGPFTPNELSVPAKERLGADQEGEPPGPREHRAHHGH